MESSVGLEEPVLVGTVRRASWRAVRQALHWEGLRAQQVKQEGRREPGVGRAQVPLPACSLARLGFRELPLLAPRQSSGPPRISSTKQDWIQGTELGPSGRLPVGGIVIRQRHPE